MKLVLASSLLSVLCFPEEAAAFTAARPKVAAVRSSSYAPQTNIVALQAVANANDDNEKNSQQLNRRDALFRFAAAATTALVSGSQIAVAADEATADPAAIAETLLLPGGEPVVEASILSTTSVATATASVVEPATTSSTVISAIDPKINVPVLAALEAPGKEAATIDKNAILGTVGVGAGLLVFAAMSNEDGFLMTASSKRTPSANGSYLDSLRSTSSKSKRKSTGAANAGYLDALSVSKAPGPKKAKPVATYLDTLAGSSGVSVPKAVSTQKANPAPVAAKPAPVAAAPVAPAPVADTQEFVAAPVAPPPASVPASMTAPMPPKPAAVMSSTPAAAAMSNPMLAGKAASAPKKGYGFGAGNWKNAAPPSAFPVSSPPASVPASVTPPMPPVMPTTPAAAAMSNPMLAGKAASAPKKGYGFGAGNWKNAASPSAFPVSSPPASVPASVEPPMPPVMPETPAAVAMSNPMLAGKAASAPKKGYGFGAGNWKNSPPKN